MKFFLIGDRETVLAFSLAGVEGQVAESKTEILTIFRKLKCRSDVGIIMITKPLAEQVHSFLHSMLMQKEGPLIVEIPDRHESLQQNRSVEAMVLSALGMKI